MGEVKKSLKKQMIPLLPLKGLTVFPYMEVYFNVGRVKSVKALEEAMATNQMIFLITQKDAREDDPTADDIYTVGTISKIKQLLKMPDDTIRVLAEGLSRAEIVEYVQTDPFFMVEVAEKGFINKVEEQDFVKVEAAMRQVLSTFEEYTKLSNKVTPEVFLSAIGIEDPGRLADVIAYNIFLKVEKKQELLDEFNPYNRLLKLMEMLAKEIEILEIEKNINAQVRKQIDKNQKEYYLREQLKVIQNELGDRDGVAAEVEEYRERMKKLALPEEVEKKLLKELDRMSKMQQGSAETAVIRTFIDWILDLPWSVRTEDIFDLECAGRILDADHYGLEKVKERILEFLAVKILKNDMKGPILCLVGPPGVGKTSVAKSIARSLNRKYVRISLGGVRDESEIRGHRRTYVGSMPGRIIAALKQAQSKNPLILLDEIDKMSSDFRGDPASAMLEVLDSEQNHAFRDHYMELPFDLSEVLFLTTANTLDTIPRPLLDRMEVIHISGYTEEDKVNIAQKYLIPKQIKNHGLKKSGIKITEAAIRDIINYYTREAGVRNLERQISSLCRKAAKSIVSKERKTVQITTGNLEKYLGAKMYRFDKMNESDQMGIATGLAWTPAGGDTLSIEVNVMKGSGKLELTGHLGDVMKESAKAAMSYIRSRAVELGIDSDFYNKVDIHIHVPEGAIPKDGPSAGITMATAMISALSNRPVRKDVAMTGEITLRGRVLPIGGLKEKALAAHRAGIHTVIIPEDNKKDIEEIPENVRRQMKFIMADSMEEVLATALVRKKAGFRVHRKQAQESLVGMPEIENEPMIDGIVDERQPVVEQ